MCNKEWADVFHNRRVLALALLLPLLLVTLALVGLWGVTVAPEAELTASPPPVIGSRAFQGLPVREQFQGAVALQFLTLFMLVPLFIPLSIAAQSVVGEKRDRTLEPLLATPLHTGELLLSKALAPLAPGVFATWGGYAAYAATGRAIVDSDRIDAVVFGALPLVVVLLLGPLVSLVGTGLALIVSSRSTDPRAAEQASAVLVLPVMGAFAAQLLGVVEISVPLLLTTAAALAVLCVVLMLIAARIFARSNILIRWS